MHGLHTDISSLHTLKFINSVVFPLLSLDCDEESERCLLLLDSNHVIYSGPCRILLLRDFRILYGMCLSHFWYVRNLLDFVCKIKYFNSLVNAYKGCMFFLKIAVVNRSVSLICLSSPLWDRIRSLRAAIEIGCVYVLSIGCRMIATRLPIHHAAGNSKRRNLG